MDNDAPDIPPGPYYSSFGATHGYVLTGTAPTMGVLLEPGGWPAGIAWLDGTLPGPREPIQCWRLGIREGGALKGKEHRLDGRWVVRDRRFERLVDDEQGVIHRADVPLLVLTHQPHPLPSRVALPLVSWFSRSASPCVASKTAPAVPARPRRCSGHGTRRTSERSSLDTAS